jgi:hypothetical protein
MGTKQTPFQPDHFGRRTEDARVGHSLNRSHNPAAEVPARHGDRPNIARDASRGRDAFDLKIHGGMTEQQINGAGIGGMGHPGAVVDGGQKIVTSEAAAPLAHAYGGKPSQSAGKPVATNPGTRSRNLDTPHGGAPGENAARNARQGVNHELGKAILAEAMDHAGADDCAALPHYDYRKP